MSRCSCEREPLPDKPGASLIGSPFISQREFSVERPIARKGNLAGLNLLPLAGRDVQNEQRVVRVHTAVDGKTDRLQGAIVPFADDVGDLDLEMDARPVLPPLTFRSLALNVAFGPISRAPNAKRRPVSLSLFQGIVDE